MQVTDARREGEKARGRADLPRYQPSGGDPTQARTADAAER